MDQTKGLPILSSYFMPALRNLSEVLIKVPFQVINGQYFGCIFYFLQNPNYVAADKMYQTDSVSRMIFLTQKHFLG